MAHHCPSAQKRADKVHECLLRYHNGYEIPIFCLDEASRVASRKVNHIWTPYQCRVYAYQNKMVDAVKYRSLYTK